MLTRLVFSEVKYLAIYPQNLSKRGMVSEKHTLDTNAEKQLSYAATDV
jgi:hypothetical protein